MKKYHFGAELQSRELNRVLRKTAIYRLQGCFRKSAVQISKLFGEIMKGKSKIIVHVIFHIDGDFNNLRK